MLQRYAGMDAVAQALIAGAGAHQPPPGYREWAQLRQGESDPRDYRTTDGMMASSHLPYEPGLSLTQQINAHIAAGLPWYGL